MGQLNSRQVSLLLYYPFVSLKFACMRPHATRAIMIAMPSIFLLVSNGSKLPI